MAAGLALNQADVTTPGGVHEAVTVLVRRGTAVVRKGRVVVAEADGVESVSTTARRAWLVTFTDGTSWAVKQIPCLPCTGRR